MCQLSIITPVYNREDCIGRAIRSCLVSTAVDFEQIVIDDASTDRTREVVREFDDPRLILLEQSLNRGPGPTRNAGLARARGEWILLLDSDDELLPGGLERLAQRLVEVPDNCSRAMFMYQRDDGRISPQPPLREGEIWDFPRWIERISQVGACGDIFMAIRRQALLAVPMTDSRAYETLWAMDFAARYLTVTYAEVVALVHADATHRLTQPTPQRLLEDAADQAEVLETLLERHGPAVATLAPAIYLSWQRGAGEQHLLAGHRWAGGRHYWHYLRQRPLSLAGWSGWVIGLIHPRLAAYFRSWWTQHKAQTHTNKTGQPR